MVLILVYIFCEGYEILKESVEVFMEVVFDLDFDEIKCEIESILGIRNVYYFYVWWIGEKEIYFECYVEVNDMLISEV